MTKKSVMPISALERDFQNLQWKNKRLIRALQDADEIGKLYNPYVGYRLIRRIISQALELQP